MIQDKENITIVMATHNNSKTIKRALKSLIENTRPPNQIIIGDNDSKDETYDILCNLLGAEPVEINNRKGLPPEFDSELNGIPIKIFRKRISTIGHTLNMALQMKWQNVTIFGFIDPTSWYAPNKIIQAIHIFCNQPSVACVVSDYNNHYQDGRVERVFCNSFNIQKLLMNFPYDRNFLVRSQIFPKLKNGFNEQLQIRDDYDLLLRISEIGLIYHIPASLHNNTVKEVNDTTEQLIRQSEKMIRQLITQRRKY